MKVLSTTMKQSAGAFSLTSLTTPLMSTSRRVGFVGVSTHTI